MKLHTLNHNEGARAKYVRRGRGLGSGLGKNGGSGNKGQKSRSGGGVRPGFEGGQNPIYRRISKRGFTNEVKVEYSIVNIKDLERVFNDGDSVCPTCMKEKGLVKKTDSVKILGVGALTKKLTVKAHKFSATAKEAIEKAGGTIEVI